MGYVQALEENLECGKRILNSNPGGSLAIAMFLEPGESKFKVIKTTPK